jgi:hypothetical protein
MHEWFCILVSLTKYHIKWHVYLFQKSHFHPLHEINVCTDQYHLEEWRLWGMSISPSLLYPEPVFDPPKDTSSLTRPNCHTTMCLSSQSLFLYISQLTSFLYLSKRKIAPCGIFVIFLLLISSAASLSDARSLSVWPVGKRDQRDQGRVHCRVVHHHQQQSQAPQTV